MLIKYDWVSYVKLKLFYTPKFLNRLLVPWRRKRLQKLRPDFPACGGRRLLVDVSIISRHDAGTGIQRVVRAIYKELSIRAIDGFEIYPVVATKSKPYTHTVWNGAGKSNLVGCPVNIQNTDVFLGLDFSTWVVAKNFSQLASWKRHGVYLYFLVHDVLPEEYPQWFSNASVFLYRRWIRSVAILADGVFCNSQDTKQKILDYCKDRFGFEKESLAAWVLPMGWDISSARVNTSGDDRFHELLNSSIEPAASALMVGTLEPRKGHQQVIAAFENLWKGGCNSNLIIVGRPGWKTEVLQDSIRKHPLLNRRLFWLDNASDETLELLYRICNGVIIASLAEGFGLPMIEAIGHGKPVLARNLPVFREQAQVVKRQKQKNEWSAYVAPMEDERLMVSGIEFFDNDEPEKLALTILEWMNGLKREVGASGNENCPRWSDTADAMLMALSPLVGDL